jgi:hypothetical protein
MVSTNVVVGCPQSLAAPSTRKVCKTSPAFDRHLPEVVHQQFEAITEVEKHGGMVVAIFTVMLKLAECLY